MVRQGEFQAARVLNLAIQYVAYAVTPSHTWKQLKDHIPDLLRLCVFPLCCFDEEDAELWADDPHEYIRKVLCSPTVLLPVQLPYLPCEPDSCILRVSRSVEIHQEASLIPAR